MQPAFVHLRLHTEFSLVDGIVKIKPLVKRLAELNMPAVAVTEHANLFSLVKFYKAAMGQGIKAIAGADVLIFNPEDPATPYRLTLLVNNHTGYITLTELISKAYQEGQHQGVPMLRQEWIEANHNGLIALSGAMSGEIGKALLAENHDAAKRLAEFWGGLFEQSFYLELQRVGKPEEERYIAAAVELALATGLPVVATNDVRFVHQQDFAAHEVRVCINQGRVLDDNAPSQGLHRSAIFTQRRGDAGVVCRYTGGVGKHRRNCQTLQFKTDAGQKFPAGFSCARRHESGRVYDRGGHERPGRAFAASSGGRQGHG